MESVYHFLLVTSLAGSPLAVMKSEHMMPRAECVEVREAVAADVRRQVRHIAGPAVVQAECYTAAQARARARGL